MKSILIHPSSLPITQLRDAASYRTMRARLLLVALLVMGRASDSQERPNAYDWRREMVELHNEVRSGLGLPRLEWSEELAAASRSWALHLLETGEFRHDGDHRHGQNLFAITGGHTTVAFVFHAWESEVEDYNHARNTCSDVCGHYTQIVWRNTSWVGCGLARNSRREVWVCDYSPTGNVVGRRPY